MRRPRTVKRERALFAVLEKPKNKRGQERALFWEQAFGARRARAVDDEVVLIDMSDGRGHLPYYKLIVWDSQEQARRFVATCVSRKEGEKALEISRTLGFYPVHVDGITLVSWEIDRAE